LPCRNRTAGHASRWSNGGPDDLRVSGLVRNRSRHWYLTRNPARSPLFGLHLRKRALPVPIIVIHALVAVSGFVLLVIAAFG
jgi:hypothetical protein